MDIKTCVRDSNRKVFYNWLCNPVCVFSALCRSVMLATARLLAARAV